MRCPERFARRLAQVGGLNRYRKPNFRVAWAQTETTRQGGEWETEEETSVGYREVLVGDGNPHWMLMQWIDAGKCVEMPHLPPQSDVAYYAENRCPKTGLQILGEYPYRGSYKIALHLMAKLFVGGQMFIEAPPLSTEIVEMMVPLIKASLEVSLRTKLQFMKDESERAESDKARVFEDVWSDARRKSTLASTAWLEDKQRAIERSFNAALVARLHRNRRFQASGRI